MNDHGIAIVGMACTYSQARNLEQFWNNIAGKVDCVHEMLPERLDTEETYDPTGEERIYCRKGGWIGADYAFNPLQFGVMPAALEGAEPDHFLVLRTVREALDDAGYLHGTSGGRVNVILGKGNYLGPGIATLIFRGVVTQQILAVLRGMHPELPRERLEEIRKILREPLPAFNAEIASGLIPNILTGRVANRLDFMGRNFTIDAACASSLIAAEVGMQDLISGKCDMVLAGGVHIFSSLPFLQVFNVMKALSFSSTIQPYDENCDGTVAGEGVGILALKRLKDAERDGNRIYAVIRSIGSSSDGKAKSVTAPRVEGEELALRRAYEACGFSPASVGLIEGHGTGTPTGDAVEIEALQRFFGVSENGRPSCALGSVKSNIGHAMPAAGAAGMIKAALSLYHGVLPPTLHCKTPRASLRASDSHLYINSELRPWIHPQNSEPRRAGVNAFGFGGINAHVVMEEYRGPDAEAHGTLLREWENELVVLEAGTRSALIEKVEQLQSYAQQAQGVPIRDIAFTLNKALRGLPERVSVIADSLPDLAQKLSRVKDRLDDPGCQQIKDRQGIFYFSGLGLREGKVALLFPGEGSQYLNMLADLCIHFPEVRAAFDRADSEVKDPSRWPPSAIVFPPPFFSEADAQAAEKRLWSIERATETVLTADGAVLRLLQSLGLHADMAAGHSAGEWIGLAACGVIDVEQLVSSMDRLSGAYQKLAEDSTVPSMVLLAVGAGREKVEQLIGELDCELHVANDNCPHQIVVVADPKDESRVVSHLQKSGVFVEKLPYDRGYHTPAFTHIREPLRACFSAMDIHPPEIPLYCCTTGEPYPADAGGILNLVSNTFSRPLLFVQTIEAMYRDGARVFVEAGPRGNLTAFVDDILRGRPHIAVAIDQFRRPGLTALNHALGMLAAAGVPLNLSALYERRSPRELKLDVRADRVLNEDEAPGTVHISTCYPKLKTPPPMERPAPAIAPVQQESPTWQAPVEMPRAVATNHVPTGTNGHAAAHRASAAMPSVLDDHLALMEQFLETQQQVMFGFLSHTGGNGHEAAAQPKTRPAPTAVMTVSAPTALAEPPSARTPVPEPAALAVVEPVAPPAAKAPRSLADTLLAIVSEKTGYPIEALSLDLDMEADLGIDSIKRVEILGAMQDLAVQPMASDSAMEEVARLKTLRQVLAFLEGGSASQASKATLAIAPELGPLIRGGTILSQVAGESVSLRCEIDAGEHLYLRDHCLYFMDPSPESDCLLFSSMPLTCAVELMAETAALISQGARVIGAKEIQVFRRINIVEGSPALVLLSSATRANGGAVRVVLRDANSEGNDVLAQATILFGNNFPTASPQIELPEAARPAKRTAPEMYTDHCMFHGPSFQGIVSLDSIAEKGVAGRLKVLPADRLLKSDPKPKFHFDAFTWDAAGQLVGYWPFEFLQEGFVVLPIRVEEIRLFQENPAEGKEAECRVRIGNVSHRTLKADYEVVGDDGRLWMRVTGWEDWRFFWANHLHEFWRFPNRAGNGFRVEIPELESAGVEVRLLDMERGVDPSGLWENLCVHMLMGRAELEECRTVPDEKVRRNGIIRNAVCKDAVRLWMQRHHGTFLYPTEVRIKIDSSGRPHAEGRWSTQAPGLQISTASCGEVAVAAAGKCQTAIALGVVGKDDEAAVREACERSVRAELENAAHIASARQGNHIVAVAWR